MLLSLCACVYYIAIPFARLAKQMPLTVLAPPVIYFSAIGMGFMLIEISQMQRLMVFLGHPVYGLSVVLFTCRTGARLTPRCIVAWSSRRRSQWCSLGRISGSLINSRTGSGRGSCAIRE